MLRLEKSAKFALVQCSFNSPLRCPDLTSPEACKGRWVCFSFYNHGLFMRPRDVFGLV